MNDEIITEVRAIKEALAEKSGFDIRRIAEEIRKSEVQSEAEGWKHVAAPLMPFARLDVSANSLRPTLK